MKLSYLLFFFTLAAYSQVPKRIQVIPNPQSIEDFDHQFKGCPENSECDQPMGLLMERWKAMVQGLQKESITDAQKVQTLEEFRSKYGLPTEFFSIQKSQQGFRPILNSSSCKEHNPKDPQQKIFKGLAFARSLGPNSAVIWRDQAQIEVPLGELLSPQKVKVYWETPQTFFLALGDQPLFIKNKELFVLKEEDGFYFMLVVASDGSWKIQNVDMASLSKWEDQRQNVDCPLEKDFLKPPYYYEFCKTVWDIDLKKTVVVRMESGCAI